MSDIDFRISKAKLTGFVIEEGGDTVAAFSTAAELCHWLEDALTSPEPERSAETLPAIVTRIEPERQRRRGLFGWRGS